MNPGRREALILGGVAVGAAAIGGVVGALALQSQSGTAELLSRPFTDLSGNSHRLVEWQGKALLCNFWATWCAPCREEIPLLTAAQHQHGAKNLQIVGIAVDNAANVSEFSKSMKIGYPILLADATAIELLRRLGNKGGGLPYTVALDRHGRIAERKLGAYAEAELTATIAGLLQ
jgi:thiol-disulfide isomerase/thioredoxin